MLLTPYGVKITPAEKLFIWPTNLYAKLTSFWGLVKSNSFFEVAMQTKTQIYKKSHSIGIH